MLWHKAWLDTRARFFVGLALLIVMACGAVITYPSVRVLPIDTAAGLGSGRVADAVRRNIELSHTFAGFIWSSWFSQNLSQMGTLFAIIIGSGSVLTRSRGALFTLSLPVSRSEVVRTRAITGLWQIAVLAFVPSMLIPLLAPAIGESHSVIDVLVHGVSAFLGSAIFFALATLFSSMVTDMWRPLLFAGLISGVLSLCEAILDPSLPYGIFHMMHGEVHFTLSALPWISWILSAAGTALLLWQAIRTMERRDF